MRKKKKAVGCLLVAAMLLLCISAAYAEVLYVMASTADVYEQPSADSRIVGKMRAGQLYYTAEGDRRGSWMPVYFEDMEFEQHVQGWIDESRLALASAPYGDYTPAGAQGYVLCQQLTIRERPDTAAAALFSMAYGDTFDIVDEGGDWYHVRYQGMERDVVGYVLKSYVLKDAAFMELVAETPAYAYPAADAKRVALLNAGDRYAVIARVNGYVVISLRGASAFIRE